MLIGVGYSVASEAYLCKQIRLLFCGWDRCNNLVNSTQDSGLKDIVSHPDQVTWNVKLVTANFKKILEERFRSRGSIRRWTSILASGELQYS